MIRGAATTVVAVAVVALVLHGGRASRESGPERDRGAEAALGLPAPTTGGLRVARNAPIAAGRSLWVAVRATVVARERPSARARSVGVVAARTPEGTTDIVLPLGRRRGADGRLWVRVRVAGLPNGRIGWVPRTALGAYGTVETRLVVDRRTLRATLYRAGRRVLDVPIAIGTTAAPTPAGSFVIRNVLRRYRSAVYGPVAFGTSARSAVTDWPGGGFVGIHGTDRPDLVPGRASHGCVRMRNDDILRLARTMRPGTPLTIR